MFASGRGVRTAAGNEPDGPWLKVSAPSNRVEANEGRASFCPRPVRDGRRIVLGPSGCGAKSRPLCKRFGVVGNTPSPPRSAASPRAEELTLQVARCSDQDRTLPRTYSRRPASPRRDPASFRTRLPRCWGGVMPPPRQVAQGHQFPQPVGWVIKYRPWCPSGTNARQSIAPVNDIETAFQLVINEIDSRCEPLIAELYSLAAFGEESGSKLFHSEHRTDSGRGRRATKKTTTLEVSSSATRR
jgi:hypothetical protein